MTIKYQLDGQLMLAFSVALHQDLLALLNSNYSSKLAQVKGFLSFQAEPRDASGKARKKKETKEKHKGKHHKHRQERLGKLASPLRVNAQSVIAAP